MVGSNSRLTMWNFFKCEEDEEYYNKIPEGRGCIVECDLEYGEATKLKTWKFPSAPEKKLIKSEMLLEHHWKLIEVMKEKLEKLVCNLYNKTNYVIHHRLLKYFVKLGLKVTKIRRTISFREEAWLKPYINFNTVQRTKAKTDFEQDIWK
jgi:hypothetical protein